MSAAAFQLTRYGFPVLTEPARDPDASVPELSVPLKLRDPEEGVIAANFLGTTKLDQERVPPTSATSPMSTEAESESKTRKSMSTTFDPDA